MGPTAVFLLRTESTLKWAMMENRKVLMAEICPVGNTAPVFSAAVQERLQQEVFQFPEGRKHFWLYYQDK